MDDNTLHPVIEIPVPAPTEGLGQPQVVAFDAASSRLLVKTSVESVNPRVWLDMHAIDLSGAAIVILTIILIWRAARILRRPQRHGVSYCRRCNYEVPQSSSASVDKPLCPECGVSLMARRPVRGRSVIRRILRLGLIFTPLLAISLFIWCDRIELRQPYNIAWPHSSLGYLKWWPLARPFDPWQRSLLVHQYSLPDAKLLHSATIEHDPFTNRFPPDFHYLAFKEFRYDTAYQNRAVIFDLEQDRQRSIDFGDFNAGFLEFQGYTTDVSEAIYTFASTADSSGNSTVSLLTISLRTLARREIASIKVPATAVGQGVWQPPEVIAAIGATPEQWAMVPISGTSRNLLSFGSTGFPGQSIPLPPGTKLNRIATLGFLDSKTIRIFDGSMSQSATRDIAIPTGAISPPTLPPAQTAQANSGDLVISVTGKPERRMNIHPELRQSSGLTAFSPDGRWLAYPVTRRNGKHVVVLIDLSIPDK